MLKIQGKPECARKTFRLPIEMAEKLHRIACINNLTQTELVIQCLNFALHEIDTGGEENLMKTDNAK